MSPIDNELAPWWLFVLIAILLVLGMVVSARATESGVQEHFPLYGADGSYHGYVNQMPGRQYYFYDKSGAYVGRAQQTAPMGPVHIFPPEYPKPAQSQPRPYR